MAKSETKKETEPVALDRKAAARYMGLSATMLDKLADKGAITRLKISPRKTVYRKDDLDRYLAGLAAAERAAVQRRRETAEELKRAEQELI